MKKKLGALLISLIIFITCYLLASFIIWDFNTGNWPIDVRILLVIFGGSISVAAGILWYSK